MEAMTGSRVPFAEANPLSVRGGAVAGEWTGVDLHFRRLSFARMNPMTRFSTKASIITGVPACGLAHFGSD
jgi:hypothetical protein